MKYKEFRTAAHRHLLSCEKMCEKLNELQNANDKRDLIADIYYLSGYIVETLLSYAIFCVAPKEIKCKKIEEHPDYERGFKTHDFRAKIHFAINHGCNFDGITLISISHPNKDISKLFNAWQVDMRYQHHSKFASPPPLISNQLICSYVCELSKMEKQFNQKFV